MAKKDKVKKPIYKRWWFIALAVIVVIGVIGNLGEDTEVAEEPETEATSADTESAASEEEATEETEAPEEEAAEEEPAEEENAEETAGIGTPLDVEGVEFTINSVSTATEVGDEFLGATAKGEYLILDVTVMNNKNEAITTDSSFFKLLANDATYEADSEASIYANTDNNFFLEEVNPGLSNTGLVVFDAPAGLDLSAATIQVQTGFFGTETGEISLQ
ncbi:DUF4352 domain-containing protein [Jeotgalibacillus haloalkalitolerans]|uniref:DUF4352 domain-containing protein n=1 Tax=Jeotgalibacillus haloalkalitolerans TaxID=3104292 RepID=A0ABU5KKB6_9BACL|nr:DUF4352 domain-containing protein [Jeotgalibacillus sp. HH7-29]MDZ5711610.1 DUF4352 domain-containing protein [Jeotgalibacillus sp. HH7-29]